MVGCVERWITNGGGDDDNDGGGGNDGDNGNSGNNDSDDRGNGVDASIQPTALAQRFQPSISTIAKPKSVTPSSKPVHRIVVTTRYNFDASTSTLAQLMPCATPLPRAQRTTNQRTSPTTNRAIVSAHRFNKLPPPHQTTSPNYFTCRDIQPC